MATIRKRGKRWEAQVRIVGRKSRSRTFGSRLEALRWARTEDASREPRTTECGVRLTIRDLLRRYAHEITCRKRGAVQEKYKLQVIERHSLANADALSITGREIAEYRDSRLKVVSGSTVRRELALLRHCFEVARKEWGLSRSDNPASLVRFPEAGVARTARIPFSRNEAFWTSVASSKTDYLLPIVTLAVETGMRRGELLSLTWDMIDFKSSLVTLPITKNGRPRTVALSPRALHALIMRKEYSEDKFVFNIGRSGLRQTWERAMVRAGIHGLRFHDLRHEAISRFFELGLSVPEVAMQSGHTDIRMLYRYTHLRAETLAEKLKHSHSEAHVREAKV